MQGQILVMFKRIVFVILLISVLVSAANARQNETLNYVVSYKWGLIHKDAGTAKITKTPKGEGYVLKLVGHSKPWADKIYKVRDTLISTVGRRAYLPLKYERIAHEKGIYARDEINFNQTSSKVTGTGLKYRENKKGQVSKKEINIEGEAPAYDLLSIFFFLRDIDYHKLEPGAKVTATVFSGDKVELLTITPIGHEKIKLRDKTERDALHVSFKFTMHGGTKSSDDIDCWLSTDSERIPLLIVGSLPVGQIRCTYIP